MRIVLSCLQDAQRHPIPAYEFWARYFTHGLEEAGHEVSVIPGVDWAEALRYEGEALEAWRARAWPISVDYIAREHRRQPVDLFLGYFFPAHVDTEAIGAIRQLGVPCVNFFCDNVRWFTVPPAAYGVFDVHWVPEKKALAIYRSAGMRAVHAPMPCWVPRELRDPDAPERLPPTFVGSRDPVREELFAGALRRGAEFDIRGAGWTRSSGEMRRLRPGPGQTLRNQVAFIRSQGFSPWLRKVSAMTRPRPDPASFASSVREAPGADEYEAVLRESMIAIGVNRYPSFRHAASRPDSYSRLRDIEGPMLGACYLTEWTEGLDDLYDLGTEIETYRTADELAGKIEALRGDASRRRSLRRSGQRRALSDHTVGRSISRIAVELGL